MPKKWASAEEFVAVVNSSRTLAEAAERLGCDPRSITQRSNRYRRHGIALKRFHPDYPTHPLDVAKLNAIAARAAKKAG